MVTYEWLCEWVQTVTPEQCPPVPFQLKQAERVIDSGKWLAALKQDAKRPRAGRGMWGRLEEDLRFLHEHVSSNIEL